MFVDYLRITYLIPHRLGNGPVPKGYNLAQNYATRAKVGGEQYIDGCTYQAFHVYPEGLRVILDFGGSVLPVELNDFIRRFKIYEGWTVSRLDLAMNLDSCSPDQVEFGQSVKHQERYETEVVGGEKIKVWTGTEVGTRGKAGSFFRVYDAKKHKKGHAAKISRFGRYDFWRAEYELSREFLRRRGIHKVEQLTIELLMTLWASETYKKGIRDPEVSEYQEVRQEALPDVEQALEQARRFETIEKMVKKLDRLNLRKTQGLLRDVAGNRIREEGGIPDANRVRKWLEE